MIRRPSEASTKKTTASSGGNGKLAADGLFDLCPLATVVARQLDLALAGLEALGDGRGGDARSGQHRFPEGDAAWGSVGPPPRPERWPGGGAGSAPSHRPCRRRVLPLPDAGCSSSSSPFPSGLRSKAPDQILARAGAVGVVHSVAGRFSPATGAVTPARVGADLRETAISGVACRSASSTASLPSAQSSVRRARARPAGTGGCEP